MKSKKIGILAMTAIMAMLAVVSMTGVPESNAAKTTMYEVTVTNLTPVQPITPPPLVTHSKDVGIFTPGEMASDRLQQLAENGNAEPLVEMLQGKIGLLDIVQGTAPLVPANDPGETDLSYSETFTVSADDNSYHSNNISLK